MALLESSLLKRLGYLAQVVRCAGVAGAKACEAPGAVRCRGTLRFAPATRSTAWPAWATHRDYSPGDDLRRVDWRIAARHDELLTRRPEDDPDQRTYVFVDASASMSLGRPAKLDVARQAAAAIGYVALDRLDEVAILAFGEKIIADFGPFRGRSQVLALFNSLERIATQPGRTDLARAATAWVRRRGRPGRVVVIGDLYHPENLFAGLGILCEHGCQPHLVQVFDPAEAAPDGIGEVELYDVETGATWTTTITRRQRDRYRQLFADYCGSIRTFCNRHRISYVAIPTSLPREELLLRAVGIKAGVVAQAAPAVGYGEGRSGR